MESEPFLNTDKISDSQNKKIILGVSIVTILYMAVAIVLLIVYAFSSDLLLPNLMMSVLILLQFGLVFVLNRWRMNDDTDSRFNYILIAAVAILVIACTVGITYAVTAQGIADPCTCPSWSCSGFYVNGTGQCLPICSQERGGGFNYLMNTTFSSPTVISGNCLSCDTDMMMMD